MMGTSYIPHGQVALTKAQKDEVVTELYSITDRIPAASSLNSLCTA